MSLRNEMIPVIAIVGRPNVGKSTLFNKLTKTRNALVANISGLTRDRQYGEGRLIDVPHIVVDTGGLSHEADGVFALMAQQSKQAIAEADAILFVVDARAGLTSMDEVLAQYLREQQKPVTVVVNKTDGLEPSVACSEFYSLGFADVQPIAASHGRGVKSMLETVLQPWMKTELPTLTAEILTDRRVKVAIVGRPNVGKSTLINRILGEERVVVDDAAGTTRDSIFVDFEREGHELPYTLIDTAGIRRRSRVKESLEKFSIIKTLQAIREAHVVILVIDARDGITDQDLTLLGFVIDAGKGLIIALNKWDGLTPDTREHIKREMQRRLPFADFALWHFISALHGTGVGDLFKSIDPTYAAAIKDLPTPLLTRLLQQAIVEHQPPLIRGRRIKLRYAHAGGHHPHIIVIHGNQTESLPESYQRYLINIYREALDLVGTPIRLQLRSSDNPFKDRRNTLTPRQARTKSQRSKETVKKNVKKNVKRKKK